MRRDGWRIGKVDGGEDWVWGMEDKGKCLELIVDSEIYVDDEGWGGEMDEG